MRLKIIKHVSSADEGYGYGFIDHGPVQGKNDANKSIHPEKSLLYLL